MSYDELLNLAQIGVITYGSDAIVRSANYYAEKLFGYSKNQLIGISINNILTLDPCSHDQKNKNQSPYLSNQEIKFRSEGLSKDGSFIPLILQVNKSDDNQKLNTITFVVDVGALQGCRKELIKISSELEERVRDRTKILTQTLRKIRVANKYLENQLERKRVAENKFRLTLETERELNELKSRFVSMASHEFRTPLAGILSSADLIGHYHNCGETEALQRHITKVKNSVQNLTLILEDFLSTDKLDHQQVECTPSLFCLQELVKESNDSLSTIATGKVNIIIKHDQEKTMLYQNEHILRNILINLLSNAIKYSRNPPSQIFLNTLVNKNHVIIRVEDFGIGIPQEDQKHLFQRFFRARNVQHIKGTGLGLNIVKRYLDLMKGTILFNSVEGKGSTFSIRLPMERM